MTYFFAQLWPGSNSKNTNCGLSIFLLITDTKLWSGNIFVSVRIYLSKQRRKAMCTNGINTGHFEEMIEQIDDHVKLERRWTHNLAHKAEDANYNTVGKKLHEAMSLLDDVRGLLDEAKDAIEDDAIKAQNISVSTV